MSVTRFPQTEVKLFILNKLLPNSRKSILERIRASIFAVVGLLPLSNDSNGGSNLVVIISENAESDEFKRACSNGEPFVDVDIHSHARSVPESKLAAGKGGNTEKAGLDPSSADQCSDIRGHPFGVTEGKLRSSKEGIKPLFESPVVVTTSIDREADQPVEVIGTDDIPAADVLSPVQKESGIAPKEFILRMRHRFGCIPCL